jgi:hypothetical protein
MVATMVPSDIFEVTILGKYNVHDSPALSSIERSWYRMFLLLPRPGRLHPGICRLMLTAFHVMAPGPSEPWARF